MGRNDLANTRFHYKWKKEKELAFATGVSLHGHTWHSHESLAFLPGTIHKTYLLPYLMRRMEKGYEKKWREQLDYNLGYWTSPISPERAYEIETRQIEAEGLAPLVSLTDHDEIAACKNIVSLEWSAPYRGAIFHIGVHDLPRMEAARTLRILQEATARPDEPEAFRAALAALDAFQGILVVLNHPLVDQGRIGHAMHISRVREFLGEHRSSIHALEINALQPWRVNQRVLAIAKDVGLPLISGGDRHGFEPNGAINLTNAPTFAGFVREIRDEKKSDILFMPQFRQSLALRYARNIEAIMTEYPELGPHARWHDRIFYRCPDGVTRSLTEMTSKPSRVIKTTNRLMKTLRVMNRIAWPIAPVFARSKKDSI